MSQLLPIFLDLTEKEQVLELLEYFQELGAPHFESVGSTEWPAILKHVMSNLHLCFKENINELDIESVCNSVISLILLLPVDTRSLYISKFCKILDDTSCSQGTKQDMVKLAVLNLLFHGLPETSKDRFVVYKSLINNAKSTSKISGVTTDAKQVRAWCQKWGCTAEEERSLWNFISDAFESQGDKERSTDVLVDLLSTYSELDASTARENAIKCIVASIMNENVYMMDHLLLLKPVKFLEGELIHNLLLIFVTGNLSDYVEFAKENRDYLKSLGLQDQICISKLRLLTLTKLGEARNELDYNVVREELHLDSDSELEAFVVEAITRQVIRCRLDQCNHRIVVEGTLNRSFGKAQWTSMQETLNQWRINLTKIQENMRTLTMGTTMEMQG